MKPLIPAVLSFVLAAPAFAQPHHRVTSIMTGQGVAIDAQSIVDNGTSIHVELPTIGGVPFMIWKSAEYRVIHEIPSGGDPLVYERQRLAWAAADRRAGLLCEKLMEGSALVSVRPAFPIRRFSGLPRTATLMAVQDNGRIEAVDNPDYSGLFAYHYAVIGSVICRQR